MVDFQVEFKNENNKKHAKSSACTSNHQHPSKTEKMIQLGVLAYFSP